MNTFDIKVDYVKDLEMSFGFKNIYNRYEINELPMSDNVYDNPSVKIF